VYGVVGDKFIEGSLRTHSPSVDPAAWLEAAFGFDDRGRAFGGGRRDKGGFRIPIGFLGRSTDRAQLWSLVEHAARTALLRQLGEETAASGIASAT
jgi:nanoRNase/pAp phosphatase (c-di-AMP/oligoRNAs hydrolase)